MSTPKRAPTKLHLDGLPCIHAHAAGMDSGTEEIVVAVPPDRDPQPVRVFATFTPDLHALVAWLIACGIDTVAMESTGVDWIPIYELLEQHGITPYLVNARHVKTVPGRKTDWNDAQWLQQLHTLGLLRGSFRPDAELRVLRTYLRQRAELIQHRAPHILHLQKAVVQMNIQLTQVLSDSTGLTGLAIIRAIVAGERDPGTLAQLRNPTCKSSEDQIAKALTGSWREEQLFVLQHALALCDYYTALVAESDAQIERQFAVMQPRFEPAEAGPSLKPGYPPGAAELQAQEQAQLQRTGAPAAGGRH